MYAPVLEQKNHRVSAIGILHALGLGHGLGTQRGRENSGSRLARDPSIASTIVEP